MPPTHPPSPGPSARPIIRERRLGARCSFDRIAQADVELEAHGARLTSAVTLTLRVQADDISAVTLQVRRQDLPMLVDALSAAATRLRGG